MLTKCTKCGKFFGATMGETVCEECSIKSGNFAGVDETDYEDMKFQETRKFVYDNPQVSPEEVIAALDVKGIEIDRRTIMNYVRQGKLVLKSVEGKITCEECGRTILSGRYCPSCTRKKEQGLGVQKKAPVSREEPKQVGTGMHSQKK